MKEGLESLQKALTPIHRLCNCMEDLLKSLINNQQSLQPEFRMTVLVSFRNILDCNANFLYLEQLRLQKDWEGMARVCRASYSKASEAHQRLSSLSQEIAGDLEDFTEAAMLFYRTYGLWSILQSNEKCIRYETYKVIFIYKLSPQKKNYSILSSENLKLAQEITRISNITYKNNAYNNYASQFIRQCLIPTLSK